MCPMFPIEQSNFGQSHLPVEKPDMGGLQLRVLVVQTRGESGSFLPVNLSLFI